MIIRNSSSSNDDDNIEKAFGSVPKKNKSTDTPILDMYSKDLTKMANEDKIEPIVGREKEIERISKILSRKKKNNPIIIGEPGVGKTALAEGLSLKIKKREVPRNLYNKRIVLLDLPSMISGTKYRGQFEERVKAIMGELEKNRDIILFIDEIHTIIGAGGSQGSLDASNMFKPALARGDMQVIGATTLEEYRKHFEKDSALDRRFQRVIVEAPSTIETIEILSNIKENYEKHHNVVYTHEAIESCCLLTERYISDRFFPDKAIDAMDEAGAHVSMASDKPDKVKEYEEVLFNLGIEKNDLIYQKKFELASDIRKKEKEIQCLLEDELNNWQNQEPKTVTIDDIKYVVSAMSGIPISKMNDDDNKRLANMSNTLQSKVIGQDDAVVKITKAIQRSKVGLKDPNKPIGSFLFMGSTGVGKTELAKQLAKYMFDSEDSMIRIDMSEYMDKISVSRLVGSPPGYVGYEDGGQLTEKVRRKPYSVVLFDEIEKAHKDVFNILLQVLDDGHLTDSMGRKVNFKNTIIIMTSNVGSRQVSDRGEGIGFTKSTSKDDIKLIEREMKSFFPPEFLNRIDNIVHFKSLEKEDIRKIIDIELGKFKSRTDSLKLNFIIESSAIDFIIEKGYDSKYGARPLKRALQTYVEDIITDLIISQTPNENDTLVIKYDNEKGVYAEIEELHLQNV